MDSSELYMACTRSDPETQAAAYTRLWEYLFRVVLHYFLSLPDAESLAQDCAQEALIRIHSRVQECRSPETFLAWARRIAGHMAIDELRRRKRLVALDDLDESAHPAGPDYAESGSAEAASETGLQSADLRLLLQRAPMSERSRRVVIGRYLDDLPDEQLARAESDLERREVLPSHVQVTRTKDIVRLRDFQPLIQFLAAASDRLVES